MAIIISLLIAISLLLTTIRVFGAQNFYEKILGLYFICSQFLVLIMTNSAISFEATLDVILLLSLLQISATLFLLLKFDKKD